MNTIQTRRLFLITAGIAGVVGVLPMIAGRANLEPIAFVFCLLSLSIAFDPEFVLRDLSSIFTSAGHNQPGETFPLVSRAFFFCALLGWAWLILA